MTRAAVVAWIVRAALAVLALQLGGVIHTASDALSAVGVLDVEHEECPVDGACDDCLAGCPNCHCAGALRTVVPEANVALEPRHPELDLALAGGAGANVPLGPTPPSVYRPPRGSACAA
ncbi:MAG TPA: hypothetical protein VFZ53_04655 [Polyangiaceae bacterium]